FGAASATAPASTWSGSCPGDGSSMTPPLSIAAIVAPDRSTGLVRLVQREPTPVVVRQVDRLRREGEVDARLGEAAEELEVHELAVVEPREPAAARVYSHPVTVERLDVTAVGV